MIIPKMADQGSRRQYPIKLVDLFKRDLFSISDQVQNIRLTENFSLYLWSTTIMRMVIEIQCMAVALIVTTQVWVLTTYGSHVFERMIGDQIALPLLYVLAIVSATLTYVRPTYWRISMSLTLYSVCIYFSMLVTNFSLNVLMTPGLAEQLQDGPTNAGVWVPWTIGFALHLQMCVSSGIIALISIRDMYYFNPKLAANADDDDEESNVVDVFVTPISQTKLKQDATAQVDMSESETYPFHSIAHI